MALNKIKTMKPATYLAGLQIRSRYKITKVEETGEVSEIKYQDDGVHLATFGR